MLGSVGMRVSECVRVVWVRVFVHMYACMCVCCLRCVGMHVCICGPVYVCVGVCVMLSGYECVCICSTCV